MSNRLRPSSARPTTRLCSGLLTLCSLCLLGSLAGWQAYAADAEQPLAALMNRLAAIQTVRTHFVERKTLALLIEPLESSGVLYYAAPDRLARHTEKPLETTLVIDGDQLVILDANGSDRLDLGQSDIARQFVDNFIVLFNGDLAALERRYRVSFEIDDESWQIALTPRDRVVKRLIESVQLIGHGDALQRMQILETSGDRSVTTFDRVQTNYAFAPGEAERVFSLDGSPAGD
jgi:outer membrane lipoprotein-sorting protein